MAKAFKKNQKEPTVQNYTVLLQRIKDQQFAPVYLLDGEEGYFIDKILEKLTNTLLKEEEKDFNLITLYGKDVEWSAVINAATRFPMFADKTVVVLREAAQLKDIESLAGYVANPSPSTVLIIDYRNKKADGKLKWVKSIKEHGFYFTAAPLDEVELPFWIIKYGNTLGFDISPEDAERLYIHLGSDLQKIANELSKIKINEQDLVKLTASHIEKYIGISRSYDFVELPKIIFEGDQKRLSSMMNYFIANPKAAPMPAILGVFYPFIERVYRCYSVPDDFSPESKSLYYQRAYSKKFSVGTIHKVIGVMNEYALKAVGINTNTKDSALLKEFCGKLMRILYH